MAGGPVIGVDLGGTKVLAAVMQDGRLVAMRLEEVKGLGERELIGKLEALIEAFIEEQPDIAAVGFGIPSQVDFEEGRAVSTVHLPLQDVPVRQLFHQRFKLPISVENDGNCAAFGESQIGAGKGAKVFVCLTVGTGIGSGVVIDGEVMHGSRGYAAEIGHTVVEIDGPPCPGRCPNNGCLESLASGTALERMAGTRSGEEVLRLARAGDQESIALIHKLGCNLGAGIASVINTFNPDVIAVGGGVATAGELLLKPAIDEARRRALPALERVVDIVPAQLGVEAGVIGAALMAKSMLAKKG